MVSMEILNDAELLYNLKIRYLQDEIYTYVGPTLLVINPYKLIPNLNTKEMRRKYYEEIIESKP
jgi:myosin heavy subunit